MIAIVSTQAALTTNLADLEQRIEQCLESIKRNWVEVGKILSEIRSKRLYKPKSFDSWLRSHKSWKISRQRADQYIRAAKLEARIDNKSCQAIPNESVAR